MAQTYVIVGASIAGVTAAETIRSQCDDRVVLIDPDQDAPYDKTVLSKEALTADEMPSIGLRPSGHLEALGIDVRHGVAATSLDGTAKTILLSDGSSLQYDRLLIATGAAPVLRFPVDDPGRVHTVRTRDDALRLRAAARESRHVAVIGAGLIGCEIASAARYLGLEVTLVDFDSGPFLRAFGQEVSEDIADIQRNAGVRHIFGSAVNQITPASSGTAPGVGVQLSNGLEVTADLAVVGTGVTPNVQWLLDSGAEIANGLVCDERLKTSLPDVFAAGDVACWPGGPMGRSVRLEHWSNAAEQGAGAALSMLSPDPAGEPWSAPTPHFMTTLHGHRIAAMGHTSGTEDKSRVVTVRGSGGRGFCALYEEGGELVGCLTIDQPRLAVRLRAHIETRNSWKNAMELAGEALGGLTQSETRKEVEHVTRN
ncbi:NAD(P)/FAD-dependent oxidoreductase [Rhodococcus sp. NPDC127530]|uniref:NAD(P)/FAD-dependent oxidoreductase n=1 Tax=unclassified Rhodococcus (in: high G+C Gram-positive bacteria) TaxID=192944 RepID=UPI0036387230